MWMRRSIDHDGLVILGCLPPFLLLFFQRARCQSSDQILGNRSYFLPKSRLGLGYLVDLGVDGRLYFCNLFFGKEHNCLLIEPGGSIHPLDKLS